MKIQQDINHKDTNNTLSMMLVIVSADKIKTIVIVIRIEKATIRSLLRYSFPIFK